MLWMVPIELATFFCYLFLNKLSEIIKKSRFDPLSRQKRDICNL